MNTALQNRRRHSRQAARARAYADRSYREVGRLDALLSAPLKSPYAAYTEAWMLYLAGYEDGKQERNSVYDVPKTTQGPDGWR